MKVSDPIKLFLGSFKTHPVIGSVMSDHEAMRWALYQGWKGVGRTSPNPMVGCVVLSADGTLLGYGHHEVAGGPHAEIAALANVFRVPPIPRNEKGWDLSGLDKKSLKGSRWFVTLEPCSHEGRTPSCAETLAQLPIGELVFGLVDPNPLVAGRGLAILEKAGIKVSKFSNRNPTEPLQAELEELIEHFVVNVLQERPFVTLKIATSLDGMFSLVDGSSKWITGERARELGHYFRGAHDAILVGRGTVERDNPALTIRHVEMPNMIKKVVVVDPNSTLINEGRYKLFQYHQPHNLIWAVGTGHLPMKKPKGIQVVEVDADRRGIDLNDLHRKLWGLGIRSLYVEGGGKTLSSHLRAGSADRLILFQAPTLIGAVRGRPWTEGLEIERLQDQVQLLSLRRMSLGRDALITGRLQFPALGDVEI